jgi:MOSC domain-containing protein YiiM
MKHLTMAELEAGLDHICCSPQIEGVLELIVRRPHANERETLAFAELDEAQGLVGDRWLGDDGQRDHQVTLMNSRAAALVAQSKDRWGLAGDQLYVDFDLSDDNAPPGTRLQVGAAIVEITPSPHTGCTKFVSRFGPDAKEFVNSPVGKRLHLRGVNACVIRGGVIRTGDAVKKLPAD